MIRLGAPTVSASLSTGLALDVKGGELTLDASWAPYVQLTATAAAPAGDVLSSIDPRKGLRLYYNLSDGASMFGQPSTSRACDLYLRGRVYATADGELQLRGFSDEAILMDRVLLQNTPKDWAKVTARGLVSAVLASFGFALQADAGDDMNIDPGAAVQAPGQSYWDFLDGTLQSGNLRLWCDESRAWHLTTKGTIQPGVTSLNYAGTVTDLSDTIALDGEYYDSLVVEYDYLDVAGVEHTSYDTAQLGTAQRRGTVITFNTAPAVAGGARRLLRRMNGRGRTVEWEAVSRFDPAPNQSFAGVLPDGAPLQTGLVSAVSWRVPEDRMTVTTRELSDTVPTMYGAQAAGVSWASIPAGVSWNGYLALPWTSAPAGETWASEAAGLRWNEYGNG